MIQMLTGGFASTLFWFVLVPFIFVTSLMGVGQIVGKVSPRNGVGLVGEYLAAGAMWLALPFIGLWLVVDWLRTPKPERLAARLDEREHMRQQMERRLEQHGSIVGPEVVAQRRQEIADERLKDHERRAQL